jgi:2-polyprenyl-3-methyl-5-hydroxy-6-metoxy-1,4-benzoquinol methylase
MKTAMDRLSAAQWDAWYGEGRAMDRLVTGAEADRFLRHVTPSADASVLDVGCGVRHEVARVEWIRLWRSAYAGIVIPG